MLLKTMLNQPFGVAHEMDRLFDSMISNQPFGTLPNVRSHAMFPAMNLWQDQDFLVIEAEIPGMRIDDVEVLIADGELTIRGERNFQTPDDARTLRRERATGSFERTLQLPFAIDGENAEAEFTDGVLTIRLPKPAALQPRRINVKTLPAKK